MDQVKLIDGDWLTDLLTASSLALALPLLGSAAVTILLDQLRLQ